MDKKKNDHYTHYEKVCKKMSVSARLVRTTKTTVILSRKRWYKMEIWRRGESNPCPKTYPHEFLRVYSVISAMPIPSKPRKQTRATDQ